MTLPIAPITGLPVGRNGAVTATLADDQGSGLIYHLRDRRGYTHREHTIRIEGFSDYGKPSRYRVSVLTEVGWKDLIVGDQDSGGMRLTGPSAVLRAVSVLFGMEDHG